MYIRLHIQGSADKFLARPGRKQTVLSGEKENTI